MDAKWLGLVLPLLSCGAAFGQSQWDHNGSTVALEASGSTRRFVYHSPRPGIPVDAGTLLFEGRKIGNRYTGKAFTFSKQCGALAFPVEGPVSQDQRSVTLRGQAPRRDANCSVAGRRDEVLVFQLKEDAADTFEPVANISAMSASHGNASSGAVDDVSAASDLSQSHCMGKFFTAPAHRRVCRIGAGSDKVSCNHRDVGFHSDPLASSMGVASKCLREDPFGEYENVDARGDAPDRWAHVVSYGGEWLSNVRFEYQGIRYFCQFQIVFRTGYYSSGMFCS